MIYIDLDGVLADFEGKVLELTGYDYMGKETWEKLSEVEHFFLNLTLVDDWAYFYDLPVDFKDVQILTSLVIPNGKFWTCQRDKVQWVKNWIGVDLQVNCVDHWSKKKYFCYGKQDILIDDSVRNCKDWESAGGQAIHHKNWKDTILQFNKLEII